MGTDLKEEDQPKIPTLLPVYIKTCKNFFNTLKINSDFVTVDQLPSSTSFVYVMINERRYL